eukprot:5297594-Alexandrium_andersonii.AAC.1
MACSLDSRAVWPHSPQDHRFRTSMKQAGAGTESSAWPSLLQGIGEPRTPVPLQTRTPKAPPEVWSPGRPPLVDTGGSKFL